MCTAAKLVIEIDGDTHGTAEAEMRDARRDDWFAGRGYLTLRIANLDVLENRDGVVEHILHVLRERTAPG